MIIWDSISSLHNIQIEGRPAAMLNSKLGGTSLPNKNVTISQAETVAMNYINNLLKDFDYHCYIHIFSMPKQTQETNQLEYVIWCGKVGMEPSSPPNLQWWEVPI
jgi:hypothetical protein